MTRVGTRKVLGRRRLRPFRFDLDALVFTVGMAKRATGVFASAPIVQGDWDGAGVPDVVTFPRGAQVGNPTDVVYANLDPKQGTLSFWIRPEWDGDDGVLHFIYGGDTDPINVYKRADDFLMVRYETTVIVSVNVAAWTAGTLYHVVTSWDSLNTIDGTNYGRVSINNVRTYEGTAAWTAIAPPATQYIGSYGGASNAADSILEGLRIDDFVWWDGTYGNYGLSMGVDLVAYAYAAGAGADPALVVGSWGGKFCLPTDATPGAIVTGPGEAWSHPLASALLDQGTLWDGGIFGNTYAVEFNATNTVINCGSDVDIDNIMDAEATVEAWIRADGWGETGLGLVVDKFASGAGWSLYIDENYGLVSSVVCATTNARSRTGTDDFTPDGKWHHVVMYFNDAGDRKVYLCVDGKWITSYILQDAGVGAVDADAANTLYIGRRFDGTFAFDGGIAWVAISNNDRHTVGTDFIPPNAFPADDANYLASWAMEEGTGGAIANTGNQGGAGSGAANRDGTLTSGAWSSVWEDSGSPVMSQALEYQTVVTTIDFGSGANIDDLPDNAVAGKGPITAEFWARCPEVDAGTILAKGPAIGNGWTFYYLADGTIRFRINCATTNSAATSTTSLSDNRWHHIAGTYDETGDRQARIWVDGVLEGTGGVSVGNYVSDAALNLLAGNPSTFSGAVGWIRVSNSVRYTATFTPNDRHNPPANDANAQLLINMTDGAGLTATDTSGNGYNGTITMGSGRWLNDQDVATVSPGEVIFGNRGLEFGSDGANDGLVHEETVVAETDYVLMLTAHPGADGRGRFQVRLRDNTGAANIVTVELPSYYGQHTGGNNVANLTDAAARWLNNQINLGALVYNITDGSVATLAADPCDGVGTTITTPLVGGTDTDWDTNDYYRIVWPTGGYRDHPAILIFCFKTPAACVSLQVFVEETSGEGTLYLHRVEIQENLAANGDHEDLDGGAPGAAELITGWANNGLDAGDTEPEAVIVHSGAQSLEWNASAIAEGMFYNGFTAVAGRFYSMGAWTYMDVGAIQELRLAVTSAGFGELQTGVGHRVGGLEEAFWNLRAIGVWRANTAGFNVYLESVGTPAGDRWSDDVYCIEMDDITLTITPASYANSLETILVPPFVGLRIDGYDDAPQPVPAGYLFPNAGDIRWNWTPRHGDAESVLFGNAVPVLWIIWGDANNYMYVAWTAANTLTLRHVANGAAMQTASWATGGGAIVPATTYRGRVRYWANRAILYVDNVVRATINAPTGFVWPAVTVAWWGTDRIGEDQLDAVFSAP